MSDSEIFRTSNDPSEDQNSDYPACEEQCVTAGCTKKCCEDSTPSHIAIGVHACRDHK